MSGHTKGPWKAIENGGRNMAVVDQDNNYLTYRAGSDRMSSEVLEANANLIAAAPDLLEALEACQSFVLMSNEQGACEVADKILSAIAKAKGEQA